MGSTMQVGSTWVGVSPVILICTRSAFFWDPKAQEPAGSIPIPRNMAENVCLSEMSGSLGELQNLSKDRAYGGNNKATARLRGKNIDVVQCWPDQKSGKEPEWKKYQVPGGSPENWISRPLHRVKASPMSCGLLSHSPAAGFTPLSGPTGEALPLGH